MKNDTLSLRDILLLTGAIALIILLAAAWLTLNYTLAQRYGSGTDLLPVWQGVRAFLFERADPYSPSVTEQTQRLVYGRPARAEESPLALDVPFPLLLLFFPLALISHPLWAQAVWMTLSQAGTLLLALLPFRLLEWRPSLAVLALLIGTILLWPYTLEAFWSGSFSLLLTLLLVGAFLAMQQGNDEVAGIMLAISAMKWENTAVLWGLLLLAAWIASRWRVWIGLGMAWFVLGGVSFLIYPHWFWPYLRAVVTNWRAIRPFNTHSVLTGWLAQSGEPLAWLIMALFLLLLLLEWFAAVRRSQLPRLLWVLGLGVAITPLIGLPTGPAHLAPLVFPLSIILPFAWLRWERFTQGVLTLIILLFFTLPFLVRQFLSGIEAQAGLLFLPSLFLILLLYWVRWYVVRPPRTWLDLVRRVLNNTQRK